MIVRHREITESKRLRRCSVAAYNAYAHMIAWSDDWGRAEWNERKIVGKLWPGHRTMLAGQVRKFLLEYQRLGLIRRYVVDDVEYFEWQTPEFPLPAASSRKWMKCPPPEWAPKEDRARWACGKPVEPASLDLPFEDPPSTSHRPAQSPGETGHEFAAKSPPLSVPSVPRNNGTPPHPPQSRGAPVLEEPSVPMETAVRLEFERKARDELRRAKRRIDHQVEQARQFAIDSRIPLTNRSLRIFRRWFREGGTLAQVQEAIEEREHLVGRDGCRPWGEISKHLGQAERELLEGEKDGRGRAPPAVQTSARTR